MVQISLPLLSLTVIQAILKSPIKHISCENCNQLQLFPLESNVSVAARQSSHLVSINVSGCYNISNTFVRHLTSVHGPTLKNVNISWTNVDCTALIYLSGYLLGKVADIAAESFSDATYDTVLARLFRERNLLELCLAKMDSKKPVEKSASTYLKNMCAYRTQEIGMRNSLQSTISSFVESCDEYEIIDSQVVSAIGNDQNLSKSCSDVAKELQREWDILSLNDVDMTDKSATGYCTCSPVSFSKSPERMRSVSLPRKIFDDNDSTIFDDVKIRERPRHLYKPVIKTLDITRIDFYDYKVGKKYLEFFLAANATLEQLYMSWADLDDIILDVIAKAVPNLEMISLVSALFIYSFFINIFAVNVFFLI